MDKATKKISNLMVNIFNLVEKLEEESMQDSSFENVSITEVHTLEAIGYGRPRTMTHVSNILGINVSTLTTAINKLVKKGYVRRFKDQNDKRIVRIALTEEGREIVEKHENFHYDMVGDATRNLSFNEKERLLNLLSGIDRHLVIRAAGYMKRKELKLEPLTIGGHVLEKPIVQAGMSIGVAGSRLASAVAINGGLGLIALTDIGYKEPDYAINPVEANMRAIKREVIEARRLVEEAGGKGLIGVNIIWNTAHAPEYVKMAVKCGAQVVVTTAGMPRTLPGYIVDKKVALIPTVSTRRAAAAIITAWSRRYNRVPDAFIMQSPRAAGLLGFKDEQLDFAIQDWNLSVSEVKGELNKLEHCPLIVGGGIFNRGDAELLYRCGADGFLMGSRFVVTKECDAPDQFKELFIKCKSSDVITVNSPMKGAVRVMKNKFSQELAASARDDYDIFKAVRDGIMGDYENGLIFCGDNPDRITHIESVEDVFREFVK